MEFKSTRLNDAYIIKQDKHIDQRGYFSRLWCKNEFLENHIKFNPVQVNNGYSVKQGTIRGLHYQTKPYEEAKVLTCVKGKIFDVMIDVRPKSSTYLQWEGIETSEGEKKLIYIPKGFAHGYQTLSNESEVIYFVDEFYTTGTEKGIRWDDPLFGIDWPIKNNVIVSDKDQNWKNFADG